MRAWWRHLCERQEGYALTVAILTVTLVAMSGVAILSRSTSEVRLARQKIDQERASYAAMAGMEHCLGYMMWDSAGAAAIAAVTSYPATVCSRSGTVGGATYTAQAVMESAQYFRVSALGRSVAAAGTSERTITVSLYYNPGGSPGLGYGTGSSVMYGAGDIVVEGNSEVDGDLYSFGTIHFAGNAKACGKYGAVGGVTWPSGHSGPTPLRADCNNQFFVATVESPVFDTYLKTVPNAATFATLPTTLPGHSFYRYTGDHTVRCPEVPNPPSRPREPYCDGPTDLTYATVVYVTGKLTVGRMGPIHDQYFRRNVIFVAGTGIDFDAANVRREVVSGENAVTQFMTVTGSITRLSTSSIQGNLVNHASSSYVNLENITVRGMVIASRWRFNNARLYQDAYLITQLTRPGGGSGLGGGSSTTGGPQWSVIGFN